VLTLVLGRLLGDRRRGALVASPLVVGFLMYGHVARNVADLGVPGFVQQAAWLALIVIAVIAAFRLDIGRVATIDTMLGRLAAVLVLVTLVLIVPYEARAAGGRGPAATRELASTTTSAPKRDVYWLVFDRYGSDRALASRYGYDNDLTEWLAEQGFTVLPDSHANYIRTVLSMATTANMEHLDTLTAQAPDSEDLAVVNRRLQDPLVARQFKALGYTYHHIGSWWDPTRADGGADVNHQPASSLPLGGDFVDALYDVSAIPAIAKRLGIPSADSLQRHYESNAFGLDAIEGLRDEAGPKFVLGHVLLPHGPFVFDEDGSYLGDDEARAQDINADERYARQQAFTNRRLREILSGLLALPEAERPIIILQADEGPWPLHYTAERKTTGDWAERATEDDLEQKYGILNAWYMPGGEDLGLDPSMTAINTFPVLFSRYFGIDYPLVDERIFSSRDWYHPYDLTDITDRLPSLR
jgi:hypothetical protein